MNSIHLGFSIPTGDLVAIPIAHMAVTGQTQMSGKTTTLEALVVRSGLRAITFVTKRGEGSFATGRRIKPYFRDRADWQFVTSIIDATLQEKNKFLRPWIMKICQSTRTLAEVQRKVRDALKTAKGINEGVYTQLDEYLNLIVPEIARADLAPTLDIQDGLNVMDISGYATPMQMLFVQSAIDWINANERNVITVIPEAWEFIPEGKGSPVKQYAITLIRKGAALRNFIWVDSQDMAGVDKTILRGVTTWIIGVQREANEIKRTLANIPAGIAKPKPEEIALQERGQFFACWGRHVVKTYVQPAWMDDASAHSVAVGLMHAADFPPPKITQPKGEHPMWKERAEKAEREVQDLRDVIKSLELRMTSLHSPAPIAPVPAKREHAITAATKTWSPGESLDNETLYQAFKDRLIREQPAILKLVTAEHGIEVETKRQVITAYGETLSGHLALLIVDGFFDSPVGATKAYGEVKRRGFQGANNVQRELEKLCERGFFTFEAGQGFQAVPALKDNITRKEV